MNCSCKRYVQLQLVCLRLNSVFGYEVRDYVLNTIIMIENTRKIGTRQNTPELSFRICAQHCKFSILHNVCNSVHRPTLNTLTNRNATIKSNKQSSGDRNLL